MRVLLFVYILDLRHYFCPQHFLNFLPLPQGQGSLRPTFISIFDFAVFLLGSVFFRVAGLLGFLVPAVPGTDFRKVFFSSLILALNNSPFLMWPCVLRKSTKLVKISEEYSFTSADNVSLLGA